MASHIEVYPTSDVHLLMEHSVQLVVRDANTLADISADPGTSYLNFDATIVTVANGNFTPVAVGESIGRIRHVDGANTTEVLVRIRVHNSIQDLWIGNNRATVFEGADNYVLSAFAKFDDNTIGDVSYHPYINWLSSDNTKVLVNTEGRLTGVISGQSAIITATHNALNDTVSVDVRDSYGTQRPILSRLHGAGTFSDRRNILFLPEGFPAADKPLFDLIVSNIKHNLLDTNSQAPYDILKDDFNVWVAFEPTTESGITPAMPVRANGTPIPYTRVGGICSPSTDYSFKELVQMVGLPTSTSPTTLANARILWNGSVAGFSGPRLTQAIFDAWKDQVIQGYPQSKDSLLGLQMGKRAGDQNGSRDTTRPINQWYTNIARLIVPDRKRMFNDWIRSRPINEYIASLRVTGLAVADPNYNVFSTWASGAADENLVCIIANDDFRCGTNWGIFAQTIGQNRVHNITIAGNKVDHVPTVSMFSVNVDPLTSVVAHEFAHSLDLLDEYEGYDNPSHHAIDLTSASSTNRIAKSHNCTHFNSVKNAAGTQIEGTNIKWNWNRINKLSKIIQAASNQSGNKIKVKLRPGQAAGWSAIQAAGTEVFLRNPDINKNRVGSTHYLIGPLTIDSIAGDFITLNGGQVTAPGTLPNGSHLYEPLRSGANILNVIDPIIVAHFTSTGLPWMKKTQCNRCNNNPGYPAASIAGFTYPRFRYETLGLYEGAGTYNCKVYRPVGVGKMRYSHSVNIFTFSFMTFVRATHSTKFSFVDKYVIVNAINPEKLPNINALYPRP